MVTESQTHRSLSGPRIGGLTAAAATTRTRLRLVQGLRTLARWLPAAVLAVTPLAIAYRYHWVTLPVLLVGTLGAMMGLGGLVVHAMGRGAGLLEATLRLDETHGLRGRLAAVLEYGGALGPRPREDREDSGYISIILADAARLGELSPKKAAPLAIPDGMVWGALMVTVWGGIFVIPNRQLPPPAKKATAAAASVAENWLLEDDAELLKEAAKQLEESAGSEEAKAAAEQFNEIVLRAVAGKIDQAEAFRLAAQLQADLEAAGNQANTLKEGLDRRGASLEKRNVTRALGRALSERKYQEAEEALKKLAERLASEQRALSKEELDQLRASIEQMREEVRAQESSEKNDAAEQSEEEKALEERQKRLLQKKQEGTLSKQEKQEMEQNERRLKQLTRQKKSSESAQKTLSELDKQLAEAARELQKEQKKAGEYLNQASETLQKGVQKQLSDEEKKEMIKQLKALKERLRRQNQDGKQAERLREFQKRARGQSGQDPGESGQEGGAPKPGQGQGEGQGQMRLGPGGVPIPVPGEGQAKPGAGKPGEGQQGSEPGGGKEPGTGHDPNLSGESSHLDGAKLNDTTAVAQDTGTGQSASETILSVAEEGFTSSSYEKLYREYETVAEEVMEKEAVPVGRKAHILRYFELIRPRGAGPSQPAGSTSPNKTVPAGSPDPQGNQ